MNDKFDDFDIGPQSDDFEIGSYDDHYTVYDAWLDYEKTLEQ